MHPTLAHDGEAFVWGRCIGLPPGLAKQIVVHLKGTANVLEGLSSQQIDEWRVGEEYRKATLDEELIAKANRLLLEIGITTPFGTALAESELIYSSWLWEIVAKYSVDEPIS